MFAASGSSHAFRWVVGSGVEGIEDLGDLRGGLDSSLGFGMSGDASVVVGASGSAQSDPKSTSGEAFRWTAANGMEGMGDFPGNGFISEAFAATPDGSVIVGRGRSLNGIEAFRWTEATGLQPLGDLPGGIFLSIATSVSDDGLVIVGTSEFSMPFIWDPRQGMRSVATVLIDDYGLDLTGWSLESAMISGDGRSLAGTGTNPGGDVEAWVAHLGPAGDVNHDGAVDGADLGILLAAWGGSAPALDLDYSGMIDGADLGILLAAWTG